MWLAAAARGRSGGGRRDHGRLSALRLRADYFAIVTIAFSEIVRYVATNEGSLTGGSQGRSRSGARRRRRSTTAKWSRFQDARAAMALGISARRSDAAMLVIVWVVALVLLTLTWLALRTPWGRVLRAIREDEDAAASLGKNVFAVQVAGSRARRRASRAIAGLFFAWEFSFFSPDDFDAAPDVLRLDGPAARRARPRLGGTRRRRDLRLHLRGHALPQLRALHVFASDQRAYLRLIIIGLDRSSRSWSCGPRGSSGSATRWCSSERPCSRSTRSCKRFGGVRAVDGRLARRSRRTRSPG